MITIDTTTLPDLSLMITYNNYRNFCKISWYDYEDFETYKKKRKKRLEKNKKISESLIIYYKKKWKY